MKGPRTPSATEPAEPARSRFIVVRFAMSGTILSEAPLADILVRAGIDFGTAGDSDSGVTLRPANGVRETTTGRDETKAIVDGCFGG